MAPSGISLLPEYLHKVFPYHVVIGSDMKIKQLGAGLLTIITNQPNLTYDIEYLSKNSFIDQSVDELFTITSPPKLPWNWKRLKLSENCAFEVELKDLHLIKKPGIKSLPLRGSMLVLEPNENNNVHMPSAMFFFTLKFQDNTKLVDNGYTLGDISRYIFQREAFIISEHLQSEIHASKNLEIVRKNLKHEEEKSQHLLEMKKCFVRYVSHEIRTPLNVLTMGLQLLQNNIEKMMDDTNNNNINSPFIDSRDTYDTRDIGGVVGGGVGCRSITHSHTYDETQSPHTSHSLSLMKMEKETLLELVKEMLDSSTSAAEILNDLLVYDHVDNDIFSIEPTRAHLFDIVGHVVESVKLQAKNNDIKFTWDLKSLDNTYAQVDISKISQVIRNLISNALKYTPARGTVHVSSVQIGIFKIATNSDKHTSNNTPLSGIDSQSYKARLFSSLTSSYKDENLSNSKRIDTSPLNTIGLSKVSSASQLSPSSRGNNKDNNSFRNTGSYKDILQEKMKQSDKGSFIRISIEDSGDAIPTGDQANLFNEIKPTKMGKLSKVDSFGFSLWVAKKVMEAHGGSIGVDSNPLQGGSTFYIDIPIVDAQIHALPVTSEEVDSNAYDEYSDCSGVESEAEEAEFEEYSGPRIRRPTCTSTSIRSLQETRSESSEASETSEISKSLSKSCSLRMFSHRSTDYLDSDKEAADLTRQQQLRYISQTMNNNIPISNTSSLYCDSPDTKYESVVTSTMNSPNIHHSNQHENEEDILIKRRFSIEPRPPSDAISSSPQVYKRRVIHLGTPSQGPVSPYKEDSDSRSSHELDHAIRLSDSEMTQYHHQIHYNYSSSDDPHMVISNSNSMIKDENLDHFTLGNPGNSNEDTLSAVSPRPIRHTVSCDDHYLTSARGGSPQHTLTQLDTSNHIHVGGIRQSRHSTGSKFYAHLSSNSSMSGSTVTSKTSTKTEGEDITAMSVCLDDQHSNVSTTRNKIPISRISQDATCNSSTSQSTGFSSPSSSSASSSSSSSSSSSFSSIYIDQVRAKLEEPSYRDLEGSRTTLADPTSLIPLRQPKRSGLPPLITDPLSTCILDSDQHIHSHKGGITSVSRTNSPTRMMKKHNTVSDFRKLTMLLKTALVVDDSPSVRKVNIRFLNTVSDHINTVNEAVDGVKAYELVYKEFLLYHHTYDIIMMDLMMPNMSGTECTERIRGLGYKGLIVGVTGNSQASDIKAFYESGVDKVFVKPLHMNDFVDYVNQYYSARTHIYGHGIPEISTI